MANTNVPDDGDTLTPAQRAWVDALRSGEYKQTTHVLCRLDKAGEPVGFCCLGVACDLAVKTGIDLPVGRDQFYDDDDDLDAPSACRTYGTGRMWLPPAVQEWLGLAEDTGQYGKTTLAAHNDAGETFERIADIIESRPEGLFEVSS